MLGHRRQDRGGPGFVEHCQRQPRLMTEEFCFLTRQAKLTSDVGNSSEGELTV